MAKIQPNKINILDVPVHAITTDEALNLVQSFVASGQPHQITTVNAEFVVSAQKDPHFMKALQSADLALADSTAVTWAARYYGHSIPAKIPGADFVMDLAQSAAENGWSLYLVGAGAGVAQLAADKLLERFPSLKIVGAEEGFAAGASDDEKKAAIVRIAKAKPDILLVAFGAPKQDLFIYENKKELGVPVMIGVGGTLDFLAGKVTRAPRLLRALSLEWLWRLLMEPKRWRRILAATIVFPVSVLLGRR